MTLYISGPLVSLMIFPGMNLRNVLSCGISEMSHNGTMRDVTTSDLMSANVPSPSHPKKVRYSLPTKHHANHMIVICNPERIYDVIGDIQDLIHSYPQKVTGIPTKIHYIHHPVNRYSLIH